ncbi:4095_t:CDS:2, partial [Scutellospora calospora]
TRSIIIAAIHKKTKIGCEQLVQEAISTCSIPAISKTTSYLHELISAAHKVIDLNQKKQIDTEAIAFNSYTKKVSVYSIEDKIIKEIYKFPYSMQ